MNRDFKGVWIPRELWLNEDLSIIEKLFLVEIDSLDKGRGCWASNTYLAEFFQLSRGRVSQIISKLEQERYIKVELTYKGKRVTKRTIRINGRLLDIVSPPVSQNSPSMHAAIQEQSEKDTKPVEKKKNEIPLYPEFAAYALSKEANLDLQGLRFKYDAWVENGWKNGNDKPIKNWKSALLNTIPHMKKVQGGQKTESGIFKIPV